jgi:hypothetical protein
MVARGLYVPAGWYMVERALGGASRHLRLGLYCSLPCLLGAGEELAVGEATHAARLGLPTDTARDRARLLERVQTLLHQGATIRQAGDALDVPTSTLRAWLRAAGIRVGTDGTLTGGPPTPTQAAPEDGADAGACGKHQKRPLAGMLTADRPPISVLNELVQAGVLTDVCWDGQATGPAHAPTFTATVSAHEVRAGQTREGHGSGATKSAARAQAAGKLLGQLSTTTA